jgi:hypothetical protein
MRESQVRILSGELKYTEFGIIKKLRGRLEVVPARSHKPNYVGSSPTPATNGSLVKLAIIPDLHSGVLGSKPRCIHKKINNMKVVIKGTFKSSKENVNFLLSRRSKLNLKKIINIFKKLKIR